MKYASLPGIFLVSIVALGAAAPIAACSGSGTTTGVSGGGSSADKSAFITDFCGLVAPCCSKFGKSTDPSTCKTTYNAFLGDQSYDASKGSACLSEMRAAQSSTTFCDNPTKAAPSCKSTFKQVSNGTAAPGAACKNDDDCAGSSEGEVNCASSYAAGAETRACQIEISGAEGDGPCIGTRSGNSTSYSFSSSSGADGGAPAIPPRAFICDTANGVYCKSGTACAKVQPLGGPCSGESYACAEGAWCNPETSVCTAPAAVGAACSPYTSSSCVTGSSCDSTTKTCVAALADGAPCQTSSQCASDRCLNGACSSSVSDSSYALVCGS